MKKAVLIFFCIVLSLNAKDDAFKNLKDSLRKEGCWHFEFMNIIESKIFDTVDTSLGIAEIASDGRYRVKLGEEVYLFDAENRYSYSPDNNQVIVESADSFQPDELTFITRLDDYYNSYIIKIDSVYRLTKKKDIEADFPDSLVVYIDAKKLEMRQLEYFDVNDDLNRVIFTRQAYNGDCTAARIVPDFPDSVERVKF